MNINNEIQLLKNGSDKKFNLSIIFVTIILFLYCYFGSYSFFENTFNINNLAYWKIIYHNFMAFVLFFGLGLLYTKLIMKEKFKSFGLTTGRGKLGLIIIGLATIIVPIVALTTVFDPAMSSTYPLIDFNNHTTLEILFYFLSYIAYYIGWEYLFRGILLQGSKDKIGALGAILLTTMISALIHTSIAGFGKPLLETMSAIPAGIIFGFVSYKTESINYSLYCHALVGILTDLFIFFI